MLCSIIGIDLDADKIKVDKEITQKWDYFKINNFTFKKHYGNIR